MDNKRILIGGIALVSVTPIIKTVSNDNAKVKLPNVIYIYADDLGYGDIGCYGQKYIKTPVIDQMANDGIMFTQHYTGAPVSAPARCCLLTGKSSMQMMV